MPQTTLDGIESLRIRRAGGNLKLAGSESRNVTIDTSSPPEITRSDGSAEIVLRSSATIAVPSGVALQVDDVTGNLDASDLSAPLSVERVHGNLHVRRIGSIAIRDTVSGNVHVKQAHSVEGKLVRGLLAIDSARSVSFTQVSGDFDCREIEGEIAVEKISGNVRLAGLRDRFLTQLVGGNLEVADAQTIEAGVIGGKLRGANLSGALKAGKIGGKLALENVAGEVGVGYVGGNARLAGLGDALTLEEVGGAIDLTGPFPADKSWGLRARGRVSVEIAADSSLELDASSRWGRIRVHGIESESLKFVGPNHLQGTLGPEPASGARTRLTIETKGSDVILATDTARKRDFFGRGSRSRAERGFTAPFEDLVGDLGADIPAFVRTVIDAANKFVADSGYLSGDSVRDTAREMKTSIASGISELERAIADFEKSVPNGIGEKISGLARELSDLVSQAVRGGSRDVRDEMRERVRAAAREMRDTIRDAARQMRPSREDASAEGTDHHEAGENRTSQSSLQTTPHGEPADATSKLNRRDAILEILAAVKEGRLEPDEADDLISAWMEINRHA
ncbi:MAG: hypothetical protein JWM69_200 [Candidatus Binatus sp.]|nr:hypothetical protein [Candidatus Binatus sp.]